MKIKDKIFIVLIIVIIVIGFILIENNSHQNNKSVINKNYCLDNYKNSDSNYARVILECNRY